MEASNENFSDEEIVILENIVNKPPRTRSEIKKSQKFSIPSIQIPKSDSSLLFEDKNERLSKDKKKIRISISAHKIDIKNSKSDSNAWIKKVETNISKSSKNSKTKIDKDNQKSKDIFSIVPSIEKDAIESSKKLVEPHTLEKNKTIANDSNNSKKSKIILPSKMSSSPPQKDVSNKEVGNEDSECLIISDETLETHKEMIKESQTLKTFDEKNKSTQERLLPDESKLEEEKNKKIKFKEDLPINIDAFKKEDDSIQQKHIFKDIETDKIEPEFGSNKDAIAIENTQDISQINGPESIPINGEETLPKESTIKKNKNQLQLEEIRIILKNESLRYEADMKPSEEIDILYKNLFAENKEGRIYFNGIKLSKYLTVEDAGFIKGENYITVPDEDLCHLKMMVNLRIQISSDINGNKEYKFINTGKIKDIYDCLEEMVSGEFLLALNGSALDKDSQIGDLLTDGDVLDVIQTEKIVYHNN